MATVFISYSHLDEAWKDRVQKQLKVLEAAGIDLVTWEDRRISAGSDWRPEIEQAIDACDVAVLLISQNFLTSGFIMGSEVPPLLQRRQAANVRVIPVIISPCQWHLHKWLLPIQARPKYGAPLTGMTEHDAEQALSNLAGEIAEIVRQRPSAAMELQVTAIRPNVGAEGQPSVRQFKLYGREPLLNQLTAALQRDEVVALYGFRGNGKSALIRQLQKRAGDMPRDWPHLDAASEQDAQSLYRRLADRLGDRADRPMPPTGSVEQMAATLPERFPNVGQEVIWIDRAHLWFRSDGWANESVGTLFRAMRRAFSGQWRWIFELRERPAQVLQGAGISTFEVRGLDKASLGEWLLADAPKGQEAHWRYTGDELKCIYQWLGGGQGEHAHPLATQILIEVARARQIAPVAALRGVLDSVEEGIDAKLLADLYDNVLAPNEQRMLQALALYRNAIPHDHIDRLENRLPAIGGWDGLDRRCLLASEADQERFFLHGFVAGWLRHRLGYPNASEDAGSNDIPAGVSPANRRSLEKLHAVIAGCWLASLGQALRITQPNITRALEAFHHALAASRVDQLGRIAVDLFGGSESSILARLWAYDEDLRAKRAPLPQQIPVLNLITQIDASDHKAWRFLGECLRRTNAPKERVMACYEQALSGNPDYPQYLANIGSLMLQAGKADANAFLLRLSTHRAQHPLAVNEFVEAIEADCLHSVGRSAEASNLRRKRIDARSSHPAFYSSEADFQLTNGDAGEAMRLLDLAQQNGTANDYTDAIRAKVLESLGRDDEASRLRRGRIAAHSDNPALYTAEADFQLAKGDSEEAMRLLNLAQNYGAANDYTVSIRAKVLESMGRGGEASHLRRERIDERSNDPSHYCAEAEYRLRQSDPVEALRLLDLAQQNCEGDNYTESIRGKVLEALGRGTDASTLRRERIDARSNDPLVYTAEAGYQLARGDAGEAIRILDLAKQNGATDSYTVLVRGRAMAVLTRRQKLE